MKKILIVDDDADFTDLVVNRLKKNNYDVTCSNDAVNGIKEALRQEPDLIIMDIMMPKMHGGEVVKLLKSYESTKDIPVLFFTALATNSQNSTETDKVNVDGQFYPAISKPFEPDKLLFTIKSLLDE